MNLREKIRTVTHWPIEGVNFMDITTLLQDADAFREVCDQLYNRYKDMQIDKVVGIDARGFIFAAVLAYKLNTGFVPVRKKGKLPYKTIGVMYALEYGEDAIEIHEDGIDKGEKVLIVDDLLATGGTISATVKLVEMLGGKIVECAFLVEVPELRGRERIEGHRVFVLI